MNASDLIGVRLIWENNSADSVYIVPKCDLQKFVTATLELHSGKCINPHNNGSTSRVVAIYTGELEFSGPYWWSTPGLQENGDPSGSQIWSICDCYTFLWQDENY